MILVFDLRGFFHEVDDARVFRADAVFLFNLHFKHRGCLFHGIGDILFQARVTAFAAIEYSLVVVKQLAHAFRITRPLRLFQLFLHAGMVTAGFVIRHPGRMQPHHAKEDSGYDQEENHSQQSPMPLRPLLQSISHYVMSPLRPKWASLQICSSNYLLRLDFFFGGGGGGGRTSRVENGNCSRNAVYSPRMLRLSLFFR